MEGASEVFAKGANVVEIACTVRLEFVRRRRWPWLQASLNDSLHIHAYSLFSDIKDAQCKSGLPMT